MLSEKHDARPAAPGRRLKLDEAQLAHARRVIADNPALRRISDLLGGAEGPLGVLAQNPPLAENLALFLEYCAFDTRLSPRLTSVLILATARFWSSGYLWQRGEAFASRNGLPPAILEQVRSGVIPDGLSDQERIALRLVWQVMQVHHADDALFEAAQRELSEIEMLDAFGVVGSFSCFAAAANLFGFSPKGDAPPLPVVSSFAEGAAAAGGKGRLVRHTKLTEDELSAHQRRVVHSPEWSRIMAVGQGLRGPSGHLIKSPGLVETFFPLAAYCKCDTPLPGDLRELVVITMARLFSSQYVWSAHAPTALHEGLAPSIVEDIRVGHRPRALTAEQAALFDACVSLMTDKGLPDEQWERLAAAFDLERILDSIAVAGQYILMSMVTNTFEIPEWKDRIAPMPSIHLQMRAA